MFRKSISKPKYQPTDLRQNNLLYFLLLNSLNGEEAFNLFIKISNTIYSSFEAFEFDFSPSLGHGGLTTAQHMGKF